MDSTLLHRFLDIGIALSASMIKTTPENEAEGLGVIGMNKDDLTKIIRDGGVTWDETDERALFEFVFDCLMQQFNPPRAFELADFVYWRYKRRVEGKDDMAQFHPN